ncbi:hypothetical protein [Paenibacillus sp. D9]|uniref:hypothetical protein n=1 Tax=Paenibacillus sp. D9 TaxID=665792 RepID=UPI000676794A|nr:hypothetical protein [Paenibacillus sp. D9]
MRTPPNPFIALLLGFIPGAGHAYLGKYLRMFVYGAFVWGPVAFMLLLAVTNNLDGDAAPLLLIPFGIWGVSMIDILVTVLARPAQTHAYAPGPLDGNGIPSARPYPVRSAEDQREKALTIVLSFIPGLGHMSLGLMQRGIAFMISFAGLGAFIIFVAVVLHTPVFLVFLLLLPVLWIYSMFDAILHVNRKQAGELLRDISLFEEMENRFSGSRKNKTLAALLSFLPGAGHLYLGLQKRGLQLLLGFLLLIYLMDSMRITLFLFMLPLLWCFSLFDALQQYGRYQRGELQDVPVLTELARYHRWLGAALMAFGVYYMMDRFLGQAIYHYLPRFASAYDWFFRNLPLAVTSFLLIAGGLRLFFGKPAPPAPMPLHERPATHASYGGRESLSPEER